MDASHCCGPVVQIFPDLASMLHCTVNYGSPYPAGRDTDTLGVMVSAKASIRALTKWSSEY